jgi:hypothetical protein
MHWLIPFAAPGSEAGRQALQRLSLPHLSTLLAKATAPAAGDPPAGDTRDELSFTPPHERALARLIGLQGDDGRLPWAAWWAERDGLAVDDRPWALLTPAHWHLGTDQLTMRDPEELALDAAASRALLDAVHDLFAADGCTLVWGAPLRWYLSHPSLATLRTASPDRVIGRNVDPWLPPGPEARHLRRLQNELQMRLHEHPLNAVREAAGRLPVNSVWISGCGVAQRTGWPSDLQVDDRLRRPALAEDWDAWTAAWRALDAGPLAELCREMKAEDAALTLCGERDAVTLHPGRGSVWRRLAARWRRPAPAAWMAPL